MTRIPSHSIEDAPRATRSLLAEMVQLSPTGRLLNLHAQMAHAPAVLEAYVSIRRATARHGTLEGHIRSALMLVAAVHDGSEYALAIISMLALRSGWHRDQVEALVAGKDLGEEETDALIGVVREAATNSGHVSDLAWARAAGSGWSDEQLAEAFAYLRLTVFTSYFLNYARTELDLPAGAPGSAWPTPTVRQSPVVRGADMDLVQSRIVTDDVEGLAAFYARLVGTPVALNEYCVEVPAGALSVGFCRRRFTEYGEDRAARHEGH